MPDPPQARATAVPDRSVRVAWVADAPAMGRTQSAAWRSGCRGMLPDALLDELDPDLLAQRWADSLRRPPTATHRALVALDGNVVVGFAAVAPSEDPDAAPVRDAELTVLAVRPEAVGHGHGSRLLAAVADTARADGFARLTTWVFAQDDVLRRFLQEAGWAPDGAHREMMLETSSPPGEAPSVHQIRLHTGVEAP